MRTRKLTPDSLVRSLRFLLRPESESESNIQKFSDGANTPSCKSHFLPSGRETRDLASPERENKSREKRKEKKNYFYLHTRQKHETGLK